MLNPVITLLLLRLAVSSSVGLQKSLSVTIYNNNFAMVNDVRSFKFDKGASFLYFTDVSESLQLHGLRNIILEKIKEITA